MTTQLNALDVGNAAELQLRLSSFARQFPRSGAVKIAFAHAQHAGEVFTTTPQLEHSGIHASCMAKLFTSALLSSLILRQKIQPHDPVASLLPVREQKVRTALSALTVVHLLNHTHGLDDTALGSVPLHADGRIDCNALCTELVSTPPLFLPGTLYNYGRAGGYLAGALIEQLYERPFRTVLNTELLQPLGVRLVVGDQSCVGHPAPVVCPSRGGHWLVTEMDVLKLLARQLASSDSPLAIMRAASQRLPGWSPTEKSIHLGWKSYAPGWYGHDARGLNSSMLARMNVELGVALVIGCAGFSGNDPAYIALSRLFRDWFPELTQIDAPRPLNKMTGQSLNLDTFAGTYRTRATAIVVDHRGGELFLRRADQAGPAHRFRGAADNLFLAVSAAPGVFPYVQFIGANADNPHEYLWNGQNVWRRTSNVDC